MPWIDIHLDCAAGAGAPGAARHAAVAALRARGCVDQHWLDQVQLIVSELVSNAVQHAGGCLSVSVGLTAGSVTVAVADPSRHRPQLFGPDRAKGHGLWIVDHLSSSWGAAHRAYGKQVWVRLPPCP
ncbi:ATP-binding protein [Dactylosporangium sp. NPDC051541]|uniref:ATP-binding protein n=1 Tax=Dactylosporangium sp. NPDC051541 TaxID=3363977 RepID=UPI0037ADC576